MNNAEIQIQFPRPGQWDEFNMTAIYQDADGYTRTTRYTPEEIPADQAPAMQAVVSALVGLGEDWQAVQVWARRNWVLRFSRGDAGSYQTKEVVCLTVEAINAQGGRKLFTAIEYPSFVLKDSASVAFFRYFTQNSDSL
ncbi:MAG: hypothetical protein K1W09_02580 [Akkermansia muciniphila]|uniref:hypothetical protein n=1 Tax=uncultured Akkermansia sp. TaxID=512294 RepID=UPI00261217A7|nr:hypothetical protein [uncultured Akkermansia sp.]